jgi:N-acetyl-gamma-glutamyl-phosphate/LysW-gamma-L-alpha-aminoadipyl-6-phosphate reductase
MKVGVVGASGYVGGEILRLLVSHPHAEIAMVTSRQYAGEYISRIQPALKGFTDLTFSELDYDKLTDKCDLVFTAVPHGTAVDIVKTLYDRGMKVIDLSADYRLHNPADYDKWYGWQHTHPELLSKSVFGVPELHREEIKKSQIVSCPGCMAVTSILGLYPLIKKNLIDTEHIIVDSKIGSSGAGAGTLSGTHHAMRSGVIRPYKPAKHRHTGEIEQELSQAAGSKIKVSMSPHAVPEKGVIPDLCRVVEHGRLGRIPGRGFDDLLDRLAFERGPGNQFVDVIHVGLVMLAVMKADCLG